MLILELLAVPFVVAGVAWVVEKLALPRRRCADVARSAGRIPSLTVGAK